ncbi:unnamed protein product [Miscanthus lutarioriparius]|uniref:AMP-dependent synthetase/ligase domain-containing protein n=1 Tax=Miscanthus lutarioriparius TaxID=422564 RepID=A0A811RXC7_9POAL|nr:unnamed protein product [Miscanthus lutarioriparius]
MSFGRQEYFYNHENFFFVSAWSIIDLLWTQDLGLPSLRDFPVNDVDATAIGFRLLRLHGFHVSPCDSDGPVLPRLPTTYILASLGHISILLDHIDHILETPKEEMVSLEIFGGAVKKYPTNRMLGRWQVTDGKAGEYVWQTYEEVYQKVMRIGSAIRSLGVEPILAVVPKCTAHLRAIVSFGDFTSEMKTEAEKFGINMKIQIKEGLGGRIRLMIAGAAPLPGQIEEFMRVTSCSIVVQGYGLTESCAGCFTSIANVFSMIGTVGPPVTTIEARLESVPEMGYDALSDMPLLCPSPDLLIS